MFNKKVFLDLPIKSGILGKVVSVFLLFLVLVPFSNLYPQYFVGQSAIDMFKLSKKKYYKARESEYKDKYVYLYAIRNDGYLSDVKIGFDKERYKNGEHIIVTLELGNESKEDSVEVAVYWCNVSSEQVKINGGKSQTPYYFNINKGDNVKIILDCGGYNPNSRVSNISFQIFNIQRSRPSNEGRDYEIIYSKEPTEQEKRHKFKIIKDGIRPVAPDNGSTRKFAGFGGTENNKMNTTSTEKEKVNEKSNEEVANNNVQKNWSSNKELLKPPAWVDIHGKIQYKDFELQPVYKGVNHWRLEIF
jgi:hypothetical protein